MTVKRNSLVDGIKFLLAIAIVVHHVAVIFYSEISHFENNCALAVDGFFLISGYLLYRGFCLRQKKFSGDANLMVENYVVSRIRRLWPELVVAIIVAWSLKDLTGQNLQLDLIPGAMVFFSTLNKVPYISGTLIAIWYVTCLFWISIILFIALTRYKDYFIVCASPLIVYICFFLLSNFAGGIICHHSPLIGGVLSAGVLRAIYDMTLGIAACYFSSRLLLLTRWAYVLLGIVMLVWCLYILFFTNSGWMTLYFPLPFAVIVTYAFQIGGDVNEAVSKFIPNGFGLRLLADSSYMLYLIHLCVVYAVDNKMRYAVQEWHPTVLLLFVIGTSLLASIILHKLTNVFLSVVSKNVKLINE